MNQIKWKVCGLRDNIADVAALQPEFIGFIFYNKSPRYVGEDFNMPSIDIQVGIKKIGVFVNESVDFVCKTVQKYQLDYAQLHGNESPGYCEELQEKNIKIIKAFQVDGAFDFEQLEPYKLATDFFLFDTVTNQYGGSGMAFDWSILKKYSMEKKYFLSGGLSLENFDALANLDLSKIHALDVNSKFEVSPGLKDVEMLKILKDKIMGLRKVNIKAE